MHAEVIANQYIIGYLAQQQSVVALCAVSALSVLRILGALDVMHTKDYIKHH
jgi:hypothetical protein